MDTALPLPGTQHIGSETTGGGLVLTIRGGPPQLSERGVGQRQLVKLKPRARSEHT